MSGVQQGRRPMGGERGRTLLATAGLLAALVVLALLVLALTARAWDRAPDLRAESQRADSPAGADRSPPAVARGRYLAQLGHCAGCHTARGGEAMAGGRVILTPFGSVTAANLTPDPETGLGRWSPAAFRRALHDGRSADGRPLLPACPYPNFSLVSPADADDLFAYLQSLPARHQAVPAPALRWPYNLPVALTVWRAVKFDTAALPPAPDGAREDWRRGAYLVGGLAHCSACHGRRDAWGSNGGAWDFRGGPIPLQGWLAPSLTDPREAAVSHWTEAQVVALLKDGANDRATVSGPMALVVAHSTQHLSDNDARAVAEFLRRLPATGSADAAAPSPPPSPAGVSPASAPKDPSGAVQEPGARLYVDHCADCHGMQGQGVADAGPALAGNRALAMVSPVNVTRVVLGGGFGPATSGRPQPTGMPPFATLLSDAEIAAVVSHVRARFGSGASAVTPFEVNLQR
jgi:mono/diheme cytochrome c family protein